MSNLFEPKIPSPIPVVNPADTANRANDQLARQLAAGGSNADQLGGASNVLAPSPQARQPTLSGLA
jgi:hypothetical protein